MPDIDESKLIAQLLEESQHIANGFYVEVYYDGNNLSFSSPMTGNTWTNDPEKVGRLNAWSLDELEGLRLANEDTVEISKDSNYYYDGLEGGPYIKEKPKDYDQFYEQSVYAEYSEVFDWILEEANESQWFDDIIMEIKDREQKIDEEAEAEE